MAIKSDQDEGVRQCGKKQRTKGGHKNIPHRNFTTTVHASKNAE